MEPIVIGLDLAKQVFQVHGIDRDGKAVLRKRLRRNEILPVFSRLSPCLVGLEACSTAHYWARELAMLGHEVRLMPPAYVKPYVKRQKNDAADAAATLRREHAGLGGHVTLPQHPLKRKRCFDHTWKR